MATGHHFCPSDETFWTFSLLEAKQLKKQTNLEINFLQLFKRIVSFCVIVGIDVFWKSRRICQLTSFLFIYDVDTN